MRKKKYITPVTEELPMSVGTLLAAVSGGAHQEWDKEHQDVVDKTVMNRMQRDSTPGPLGTNKIAFTYGT